MYQEMGRQSQCRARAQGGKEKKDETKRGDNYRISEASEQKGFHH